MGAGAGYSNDAGTRGSRIYVRNAGHAVGIFVTRWLSLCPQSTEPSPFRGFCNTPICASYSNKTDIGWFLVAWTGFTAILWVGSMRLNGALALTFTLLLIGFILLDLAHFGYPNLTVVAGYELMVCAAMAWYIMAHLIFADVFGRDVLPVGKPWLDFSRIEQEQIVRTGVQEAEAGA